MAKAIRKKQLGKQERSFKIDRALVNKEQRTVELAFSSEQPVERWWGTEILSHEGTACDLSRLNNSAPLLLDHDSRNQIGVVEKAHIDGDKKGRALVRFGKSARAEEIFADVMDGVRGKVSVGYSIRKMQMEEMDGDPEDGDGEATYRATDWIPYELSLVSIPADDTVGVGRDVSDKDHPETLIELSENMKRSHPSLLRIADVSDGGGGSASVVTEPKPSNHIPTKLELEAQFKSGADGERNRQCEIMAIGSKFRKMDLAQKAMKDGTSVDKFRELMLEAVATNPSETVGGVAEGGETSGRDNGSLSVGELFVRSQAYRDAAEKRGLQRSFGFSLPDRLSFRGTLLTTGLTSIQKQPGVVLLEQQPLTIADLLIPGQTGAATVRYIAETAYTNAATAVAEEGSIPEATFSLAETDATVQKIAVIGRITEEMLADYEQTRSYVDGRLAFMVGSLEDNHLLNGSGNTNQIKGILNFTNVQTVAAAASATVPDAIMKAITAVAAVGFFAPTAIVLHPTDWQNIRLMKDANGQYLFGGPAFGPYGVGGYSVAGFMWGLPVIATTAIAQGTGLVGAFRPGAQLFRRQGLMMETSNSDASDFKFGRIAIRAYTRLALACYRPLAFCTITGIA